MYDERRILLTMKKRQESTTVMWLHRRDGECLHSDIARHVPILCCTQVEDGECAVPTGRRGGHYT